jgi:hypothetical protein
MRNFHITLILQVLGFLGHLQVVMWFNSPLIRQINVTYHDQLLHSNNYSWSSSQPMMRLRINPTWTPLFNYGSQLVNITPNIVVPEQIQHKSNYFSFCQIFEKLFNICGEILIILKLHLSRFEPQTFKYGDIKLRQSKHTKLFHNLEKKSIIILYTHYLPNIKKPSVEVKI